jgi:hypothetical protein
MKSKKPSKRAVYSDQFLEALGAWQRGWKEQPDRKEKITEDLLAVLPALPKHVRIVDVACYRKRYLRKGDFEKLFMGSGLDDGPTSWTTDKQFAEVFKGFWREGETAAIFEHTPGRRDALLNIPALWKDPEFVAAAAAFRDRGGVNSDALWGVREKQSEVVLRARLRREKIVGFTGKSSSFDELCEGANITDRTQKDAAFKRLVDEAQYPELPRWIDKAAAQRVVARVRFEYAKRSRSSSGKRK